MKLQVNVCSEAIILTLAFHKKAALKHLAKLAGQYLPRSPLFNKLQAWNSQLCWKRDSGTSVFLWISRNIKEQLFCRRPVKHCFSDCTAERSREKNYFSTRVNLGHNLVTKKTNFISLKCSLKLLFIPAKVDRGKSFSQPQ